MFNLRSAAKRNHRCVTKTEYSLEDNDMFRKLQWRVGAAWCRMSHESVLWPLHGEYRCRTCGRRYPAFSETPRRYQINRGALTSAVSLLLVAAAVALAQPAGAASVVTGQTTAEAEAVLERYSAPSEWRRAARSTAATPRWPVYSSTHGTPAFRRS